MDKHDETAKEEEVEYIDFKKPEEPISGELDNDQADLYAEALRRYPNDESIDQADEKRLKRKLDTRIIPLLGICYFFYVRRIQFGLRDNDSLICTVCRQDHLILRSNLWHQERPGSHR